MDEPKHRTLDVAVHRRILRFLNDARGVEDLMEPPPNGVLLIDERIMQGDERLHLDEHPAPDHAARDLDKHNAPVLERALAKQVLRARDAYNPVYGFRHISQLETIPGFNPAILDRLIWLFSPRFRGKWELLYDDAD
jgi:hypothetical protein